jgi:Putative beta-barrel porin-2, OmpL-like. bbp2
MFRKCLTSAAVAVLASASAVWAADANVSGDSAAASAGQLSLAPSYLDDQTPTSLTPVMYELDKTSFGKTLESWNIDITGFGEGGYFYDTSNPRIGAGNGGDAPTLIAFPGLYSNRGQLDQADLTIQKTIDTTKKWDWGFQIEQGYGTDDAQIHSYGLVDNRAPATQFNEFNSNPGAGFPRNQYDIIQANASLLVPLGTGLQIKAGKFVTLLSEEVINPTGNLFYTHSYNFAYGVPATNTGVLGIYTFPKLINGNDWTFTGGVTRGWNESLRDNNGAVDFMGEMSGNITDKLSMVFNAEEGPEGYGIYSKGQTVPSGDNSDYWTDLEAIPSYKVSDQLTLSADCLYGDAPHSAATTIGQSAQWYGVAAYGSYKFNSNFTFNARGEWYRDQGGMTVEGVSANYYEATVGVQIHPWPTNDILQWLQFRPEVRYDWSDRTVYNFSHSTAITGAGDYSEFTVAMDAIMQF